MYYSDKPISSIKEDLFHRKDFACNIAKTITCMCREDNTYTIGLLGKWGCGKTSLINMIEQELTKENSFVIVRFEPWNFSDANQLIDQFFVRMSNVFKSNKDKSMEAIGKAIDVYNQAIDIAKQVTYIYKKIEVIDKILSYFIQFYKKENSLEKDVLYQKQNVEKLLKDQKNRVLIIIDDIDRLSNEQIRYIFHLVTAVAKFPNVTYILSFDRAVVVKALEEVQNGDGNEYLEKVIQIPINIPELQESDFYNIFIHKLEKILAYEQELFFDQERWEKLYDVCIRPMIKNIRDVNRLCNVIQFKVVNIAPEIDFIDIVILTIIELFYPCVYEWIIANKEVLTTNLTFRSTGNSPSEKYTFYKNKLNKILETNMKTSDLTNDIEYIIQTILCLFPVFANKIGKTNNAYNLNTLLKNNQVGHPNKFDRYFQLDLNSIKLRKKSVIVTAFGLSLNDLKRQLIELEKEGCCGEFLSEIVAIKNDITEERAKIIISAIIEVGVELNNTNQQSVFSVSTAYYAKLVAYNLFENITESERLNFLKELIETIALENFNVLADMINQIELTYGRLAANGHEHNYAKIISLQELESLENIFMKSLKEKLKFSLLFDMREWFMVFYMMECYDKYYAKSYVNDALKKEINILKFIPYFISTRIGAGKTYRFNEGYDKYLTNEQMVTAIESCVKSKDYFGLSTDVQECCCAAYFMIKESKSEVYGGEVEKIINNWKYECFIRTDE